MRLTAEMRFMTLAEAVLPRESFGPHNDTLNMELSQM